MKTNQDATFLLSGGATNTDTNLSLGGVKSSATASTQFPSINPTSGAIYYYCIYLHNTSAATLSTGKLWLSMNTPSSLTTAAIGVGTSGVNGVEQTVAAATAPTGVSFSAPTLVDTALSIPDLPAGEHQAIWVAITTDSGVVGFDNDGCSISFQFT